MHNQKNGCAIDANKVISGKGEIIVWAMNNQTKEDKQRLASKMHDPWEKEPANKQTIGRNEPL